MVSGLKPHEIAASLPNDVDAKRVGFNKTGYSLVGDQTLRFGAIVDLPVFSPERVRYYRPRYRVWYNEALSKFKEKPMNYILPFLILMTLSACNSIGKRSAGEDSGNGDPCARVLGFCSIDVDQQ